MPKGAQRLKIAARKMVPLRARILLRGSEIQAALLKLALDGKFERYSYKTAMVIYGEELMKPMIHAFLLQMASVGQLGAVLEMPSASAKVKLAPLEAAHISIVIEIGKINLPV
jgi:hypothetical protein